MNKLTILIVVVVSMAVCNARVLHAKKDLYDLYDGLAERGLYDLYEDLSKPPEKLKYPADCDSWTLRNYAEKCGLVVSKGGKHYIIKTKDGKFITTIPHSVKANGTCREIINILNGRLCEEKYYDSYAAYDSYNGKEY